MPLLGDHDAEQGLGTKQRVYMDTLVPYRETTFGKADRFTPASAHLVKGNLCLEYIIRRS
jgi:hypothetical protein